jgi:hypothetical protein
MKMVLEIPDEISEELSRKLDNPARSALEALAAAAYGQNAGAGKAIVRLGIQLGGESGAFKARILAGHVC